MPSLNELKLKRGEKGFISGQNGTGKSYLARQLLPRTGNLAIIDPKGLFEYDIDIERFANPNDILRRKPKRFIYSPDRTRIRDYAAYNDILLHTYLQENTHLYIDEIILLLDRRKEPIDLQTCYQLGRQKGITLLAVSQRPALIPGYMVSEAQKFFVFTLTKKADRERIEDSIGKYKLPRSRYEFVFKDIHSAKDPVRLLMPKGL